MTESPGYSLGVFIAESNDLSVRTLDFIDHQMNNIDFNVYAYIVLVNRYRLLKLKQMLKNPNLVSAFVRGHHLPITHYSFLTRFCKEL